MEKYFKRVILRSKLSDSYVHKIVLLFSTALIVSLTSSILSQNIGFIWWHIGTIAGAFICFVVPLKSPKVIQKVLHHSLLILHVGLTIVVILGALLYSRPNITLFFDNENLLSACMVVLAIACCVLRHDRWLMLFQVPSLVAVALIGSRIAIFSYVLCFFLISLTTRKNFWLSFVVFGVICSLFAVFMFYVPADRVNLLKFSNSFTQAVWQTDYVEEVQIVNSNSPGPFTSTRATLIHYAKKSSAKDPGLLLLQTAGPSSKGEPYIASIYLRSDIPLKVLLSNNISYIYCDVVSSWSRCVTPPGIGDGNAYALLRLRAVETVDSFDLEIWGPQLEIGLEAKRSVVTEATLFTKLLYRMTTLRNVLFTENSVDYFRLEIFAAAWNVFLQTPVAGQGIGQLSSIFSSMNFGYVTPPAHAHNLVLQTLGETGVLGLLSWLIVFWGTLFSISKQQRLKLAPLVTGVLMLNVIDFTYYANISYFGYWLTVGLVASEDLGLNK